MGCHGLHTIKYKLVLVNGIGRQSPSILSDQHEKDGSLFSKREIHSETYHPCVIATPSRISVQMRLSPLNAKGTRFEIRIFVQHLGDWTLQEPVWNECIQAVKLRRIHIQIPPLWRPRTEKSGTRVGTCEVFQAARRREEAIYGSALVCHVHL